MCVMGILKLLMGIIGTGMVLTGSTGGSEQQEDKENTDNQSGKDQDNSNSDVANASGDNTSTQSSQHVGNSEGSIAAGEVSNAHSASKGLVDSRKVKNLEYQNFRKKHAMYCYDMLQAAFNWQGGYAYVTHDFHNFLDCIAGNDQEIRGLCFLVLKASVLFQYCMLHCRHEVARLLVFDQRSLRDPMLLNNLLSKALSILSNTDDPDRRMYFSYLALCHISYSQLDMKEMISPQFYRDIQGLLCRIFEYKITNGFDPYIKFTHELLIGCALFLGGMYNQIHTREATTEVTVPDTVNVLCRNTDIFRERINSNRRSVMAWQDLGYRCYRLFISMLYMYTDDTRLFRRGVQAIPQKLIRQCSEDIVTLIDSYYLQDEMPYSVIAGNIAGSLSRLINRNNISIVQEDITLYEQHCIRQCSMSVKTSTDLESQDIEQLNVSMSIVDINEEREGIHAAQQPPSSSLGEGAVGEVAGSSYDYTRLGARPKVRSRKSSDKTLKQGESHTSVKISQVSTGMSSTFVDKKSKGLVGIIKSPDSFSSQETKLSQVHHKQAQVADGVTTTDKLSNIDLQENVIQPVHISEVDDNLPKQSPISRQGTCVSMPPDHIRKFRRLHVIYLYDICRRLIFSTHGEIKATVECAHVMSDIFKSNKAEQKFFLLMLKVSMLLQFCGAHFSRERIRYIIFDARPWAKESKNIDYILCEILGVINTSSSLSHTIMSISRLLRQKYDVDGKMLTKMRHMPDFYRKVMNLLCRVYQYKRECSNFGQDNIHTIVISQVIICCAMLMGSMYCSKEGIGIRGTRRTLDVEFYHLVLAFMYLYEVQAQGAAKVDYIDHSPVVIPPGLSRLCSKNFVKFLKKNYPGGEVPFSIHVEHLIERLDRLITGQNVAWIFSDIEIYEHSFMQNRRRSGSDYSRGDGTGGENDNFPDQQRASGDGRGL
ncbi:DUF3514 domain-containing protein [Ehrlichia ruminantium]|nr:DUF3514 domain-containing protein [Ehrlichia ruminantium]QLK53831.1 DUF3514 domain-containing protein [Ehrlichia ruminantium]QLK55664.1 DUF3514 domain-containing protein [Ehrlichia ruminantium]QLK56583.1 DUF3514 domain-containing protein [Ehrlichia ruminantium]UOD99765.1 DUF3514 domain-containing protein [Ehrlichia ruminantium]